MKELLQRIYGMQYEELEQNGKDGNKARFNGNILVAAYLIVAILLLLLLVTWVPGYNEAMTRIIRSIFGYSSGKTIGRLLAIPLFAILYYVVTITVGSESSFRKQVEAYKQFSEEEKKKSLVKVMVPFMSMLGLLLILALSSL
jgi:hypothetical protein